MFLVFISLTISIISFFTLSFIPLFFLLQALFDFHIDKFLFSHDLKVFMFTLIITAFIKSSRTFYSLCRWRLPAYYERIKEQNNRFAKGWQKPMN
ncbi:hypothetical protein [uncultured Brachyspira sp.]|uniref:hypothetical protein n=1 Tax=uncultured Brachyspira sp. TaxID=221953 RepID=UPI00320A2694